MKSFKKTAALLILLPLLSHAAISAPAVWALNETLLSQGEYGPSPVKTLEQAQAETLAPAEDISNPNDFFNEKSLFPAEIPVSEELKAAAEVFIAGHEFAGNLEKAGKKPANGSNTWGLEMVNAQQAWALTRGAGITIAVIDTGLDFKHEDIKNNFFTNEAEVNGLAGIDDDGNGFIDDTRGWDFVNNDNNPADDNGHGSHVSGIAAADSMNSKGIAGVAPDAKVLAVKVLDASGSGIIENVIKGIKYAADLGAEIINMSLGIFKKYLSAPLLASFQAAVDYATHKGSVIVTAAGNEGVDSLTTAPAGLNHTIAVGAVDDSKKRPSFSNKNPDLVAPGVDIYSLKASGGYLSLSGTSMASPFVAGAAALIRAYYDSAYTGYTGEEIYDDIYIRLTASALELNRKKDYDTNFGYGLLDVYKALMLSPALYFTSAGDSSFSKAGAAGTGAAAMLSAAGFESLFSAGAVTAPRFKSGNWYQISAFKTDSKKRKTAFRKLMV